MSAPSIRTGASLAMRRWARVAAIGLAAAACLPAAAARDRADDHERAREAVRAGEVMPLGQVLERIAPSHPGQVLEVELERDDGRWVYELKLLATDGSLLRLELDARTAEVLRVRRRDGQR